jgi:translation initiation factor IF-1
MKRNVLPVTLILVVMLGLGLEAGAGMTMVTGSGQASTSHKLTLREKVFEIPPQTMVEVKLKNKEKVRGRLGEVSNEGFVVRVATGQRIEDRKIAFDDVKSMKKFEGNKALKVVGYSALVTGVVIGTAIVITAIVILVST